MIVFAAGCGATQECVGQNPGWGKLIALVLAGLLFWGFTSAHARMGKLQNEPHSPTDMDTPAGGVKPQVSDTADTKMTPRGSAPAKADDDLERFVQQHAERLPTSDLVRLATAQFRKSRSTVLRRLKEAREARDGVLPDEDDES
jgi:hypothetical protein